MCSLLHSPDTRTCRDLAAARILSATSICWSRARAVSQSVRRWCRVERRMIGCASRVDVSKKFDSTVARK